MISEYRLNIHHNSPREHNAFVKAIWKLAENRRIGIDLIPNRIRSDDTPPTQDRMAQVKEALDVHDEHWTPNCTDPDVLELRANLIRLARAISNP